ncbi:hypothetical protein RB195_017413 [Necator americanus]|uniref:Uncharacterized protein n=1 Tax=Necator americanus TaxID=51031 RepID=A0ABR1C542_NECAM
MLPCFPSRAPMVLLRFKALYQPNAFWYAGSASFAFLQYTYHCTSGVCNVYLAGVLMCSDVFMSPAMT